MKEYVGRWLLKQEGLVRGYLELVDDEVSEVCTGVPPSPSENFIIAPAFVNAHTHVGDSIAYPAPKMSIEELVGPVDGYKHRILRSGPREKKVAAMAESIGLMARTGASKFIDFREEGLAGIQALEDAAAKAGARPVILGRPTSADTDEVEISALLKRCDGIGMSAMRDWPIDFMRKLSRSAQSANKLFALHASESVRESIDDLVELEPDFVVHMTKAQPEDIGLCAQESIPIVVCPRSNEFFGLKPDIPTMLKRGALVGLGTDNCMIVRPDMVDEMKAAFRLGKESGAVTPLDVVNLATFHGRKILSAHGNIATEVGEKDDIVLLRSRGEDPLFELVTNGTSEDIGAVIGGGKVRWRSRNWTR